MAELGETLSDRELDVLRCVVNGASNKEVAAELSISENTVKVHLRNIYTKLGVSSRTEATTVALQQGLATIPGMETAVSDPLPPEQDTGDEASANDAAVATP
ncbi:MAG TPA: response regulator transcription factor, partial [Anaerolineales bacterium]|nr:response regulator transcription factor [Anaerolineales bacterium]